MQSYFATRLPEQQWHELKPEVLGAWFFKVQGTAKLGSDSRFRSFFRKLNLES
jgi:hypothetical protein